MNSSYIGAEQVTEEDRAYVGSRFSEVRRVIRQSVPEGMGRAQ